MDTDVMTPNMGCRTVESPCGKPSIWQRPKDWETALKCAVLNPPQENRKKYARKIDAIHFWRFSTVYFTFGSMMLSDLAEIRKTLSIWHETIKYLAAGQLYKYRG